MLRLQYVECVSLTIYSSPYHVATVQPEEIYESRAPVHKGDRTGANTSTFARNAVKEMAKHTEQANFSIRERRFHCVTQRHPY